MPPSATAMNTQRSVSKYGTSGRMAVCVSASTCWATSTPAAPPLFTVRLCARLLRTIGASRGNCAGSPDTRSVTAISCPLPQDARIEAEITPHRKRTAAAISIERRGPPSCHRPHVENRATSLFASIEGGGRLEHQVPPLVELSVKRTTQVVGLVMQSPRIELSGQREVETRLNLGRLKRGIVLVREQRPGRIGQSGKRNRTFAAASLEEVSAVDLAESRVRVIFRNDIA